jgi:hypothetical protein
MIDYYYKLQSLEIELLNIEQEIKDLTAERNQIIHDTITIKDILFDIRLGS